MTIHLGKISSINYENSASGSFLIIGVGENDKIYDYQIEMIANNSFKGIVKFDCRYKNNVNYFYYNITSKIQLEQFLKRNKLKRDQIISILQSVSKNLLETKNYLLCDKNYIIDKQYIYIDPKSLELEMVYLPLVIELDAAQEYKSFVADLILNCAIIDESAKDSFIIRILNSLKSEQFNTTDFDKLLTELKQTEDPIKSQEFQQNLTANNNPCQIATSTAEKSKSSNGNEQKLEIPLTKFNKSNTTNIKSKDETKKKLIPESLSFRKKSEKVTHPSSAKMVYKTSSKVIAIVTQVIVIALIICAEVTGAINSIGEDPVSTWAGIGIVIAGGDFILFRTLFDKNKMVKKSFDLKKAGVYEKPEKSTLYIPQLNMTKKEIRSIPASENDDATTYLNTENFNKTAGLKSASNKYPYLKYLNNGIEETIAIKKQSFIIGRLRSQVDYVAQNAAIGKVHAEIISKNMLYFVKDLNSSNGTFINGERLNSSREYEIKNEDKLTLANVEYTFVL